MWTLIRRSQWSRQIREEEDWEKSLKAGGKYYFTRFVAVLLV